MTSRCTLVEHDEQIRATKLEALREDIVAGLAGGPAEPMDMNAIKAEARLRARRGDPEIERDDLQS